MELNALGELIRQDEPAGPPARTVDRVVTGALRRGHRTRIGRRVAAGTAGGALVAAAAAAVLPWSGPSAEVAPAAPPTTVATSPSSNPSRSPSPTPTPTPVKPPTQREVLSVLTAGLPSRFEVGRARLKDESLESGVSTSFVVTDRAGRRSWAAASTRPSRV